MELFIIIPWFILCFMVAGLWSWKGRSWAGGFWVSFFLSPLVGFIIGLCIAPARRR